MHTYLHVFSIFRVQTLVAMSALLKAGIGVVQIMIQLPACAREKAPGREWGEKIP